MEKKNKLATASLWCGIAGLVVNFLGMVELAAIILGFTALKNMDEADVSARKKATAGIVLGCVKIVAGFGICVILLMKLLQSGIV